MDKRVFLIAGEASGDTLGASLMKGLKAQGISEDSFEGVGGDLMEEQGLESLLPMDELCVMGLWEVAGHLPRLIKLIQGLVEEIEESQPDYVVTIDLPDFNFQLAKRLKARDNYKGKIIHYVAPSVWAWRPKRAENISKFLDGLMCLFPFEPPFFEKHGLKTQYVGHPLIEIDKDSLNPVKFRKEREIEEDATCVGMFLGSRVQEIKTHKKAFVETIEVLEEQIGDLQVIIPTLPNLEFDLREELQDVEFEKHIVPVVDQKWDAFAAFDMAMAVSGTVGLELAYMNVPHIIGYKANPVTAMIVKSMIKINHVHLANILLEEEAVPEYLQGKCNVQFLARGMLRLHKLPEQREKQFEAFKRLRERLQLPNGQMPTEAAAQFVLSI
ncbi:MAG: lipid-A-disaccharide synthase [Alphaproteobacteria bacterium]|nr:lipid-A-disaccharide synthase [Alphaproteobacteria bacterium]